MARRKTERDEELSKRPKIQEQLTSLYKDIKQGYIDQRSRVNDSMDYWDAYNCVLNDRQVYNGNAKFYVPLIRDAIDARKTRYANQLFPQTGRYVMVTTANGDPPTAIMSLLEYYVRRAKLRTRLVEPLCVQGDVEGQYTVYTGWREATKHIVVRHKKEAHKSDGVEFPELGEYDTVEEETEYRDAGPYFEIVPDADLCVLPATVDSIDDALREGGSVTIQRRWTKATIRRMADDGDFVKSVADQIIDAMGRKDADERADTPKEAADAAGIKGGSKGRYTLGYETWTMLKVDGERRLCRVYFGGENLVLGCKLCPYWNDKVPLLSAPVEKVANVFKGQAPAKAVIDFQVSANDAFNEGEDTAHFSAMPIVLTDPEKNPRSETMVLNLAAVWLCDPNSTEFAKFPTMWKDAVERIKAARDQVFQTLGVNASMIPQQSNRAKKNQAEINQEQQVDLLTTSVQVTTIEDEILTPLLSLWADYDHQFRETPVTTEAFGELGIRAEMESIEPIRMDTDISFRWFGVESQRNAAQIQQQIAMIATLMKMPPQFMQGFRINGAPLIRQLAENTFGPRLGPLVVEDLSKQMGVDPQLENEIMLEGFEAHVHPGDNDPEHLEAHMAALQDGDLHGTIKSHIQQHMMQLQQKAAAMQGAMPGGAPGGGGGPQPGAQPGQPRVKGPPGSIHPDAMPAAGGIGAPRKT